MINDETQQSILSATELGTELAIALANEPSSAAHAAAALAPLWKDKPLLAELATTALLQKLADIALDAHGPFSDDDTARHHQQLTLQLLEWDLNFKREDER